ncbi:MAG TPA: hypothetical protein DGG95_18070 [Cytophagales bacterium]|jgi:hypothetical protein|nr:hypothetical protein [Cytophagales bacterium]
MAMNGAYGGKSVKKKMTTGGGKTRSAGTAKRSAGTKSTGSKSSTTKKVGGNTNYKITGPKY